jgi:hypothetical protein
MPVKNNNKNKTRRSTSRSVKNNNNYNNMKKDFVLPLIAGLLLGALLMIFWQFNARLNNTRASLSQIEQVTTQNSQSINEVVTFINQVSGQTQGGAQGQGGGAAAQITE